jgi:hypothetical protein
MIIFFSDFFYRSVCLWLSDLIELNTITKALCHEGAPSWYSHAMENFLVDICAVACLCGHCIFLHFTG